MNLPQRKNHRLKNYDYGSYGYYYVTICTLNRMNLLCEIVGSDAPAAPQNSYTKPSFIGEKVVECFNNIALLNENIEIDKFVLMPNHIHAIILIKNTEKIEYQEKNFNFQITERRGRRSLQGLIKDFKSVTTRCYKKMYNTDLTLWQKSFYDRIIRNEYEYQKIWQYIDTNPLKWEDDSLYVE